MVDCISNHLRAHWTELWWTGGYPHIRELLIQSTIKAQAYCRDPRACRCLRDQCAHHLKLFSFLSRRRTLITWIEELTLGEHKNRNCHERQPWASKSFLCSSVTHSQLLPLSISPLVRSWVSSTCSPSPSRRVQNVAPRSAALSSTRLFVAGPSPQDTYCKSVNTSLLNISMPYIRCAYAQETLNSYLTRASHLNRIRFEQN